MLIYLENYGPYAEFVKTGQVHIFTKNITKENWQLHFDSILNILRDGIETEFVHRSFITIDFGDIDIELTIPDYWFNLMMWQLLVATDIPIRPKHIFFNASLTRRSIKSYVDDHFLEVNRRRLPNIVLNNTIDDMMNNYQFVDEFSLYLANTINLEDSIKLMNQSPEFNQLLHADLSNVPLAEVKHVGMDFANRMIDIIKKSDHCLADFFKSGEGINPKQFKEFNVNIGTKPDGRGGVYPATVNSNFVIGGVNDLLSFFIESSTGRIAQIIVEGNVGISGYFARLMGLNNIDTIIHPDPDYVCDSQNFQEVDIKNEALLSKYEGRHYRLHPNGMEYLLKKNKELVGKKIYLRSPMTCASHSRGEGICYRCYGELAFTNNDINIGKIAAEEISSKLTQMMLSAKHLLESAVKAMTWSQGFKEFFEVDYNMIKIIDDDDMDLTGFKLLIDPVNITLKNEFEKVEYNEYISEFEILTPNGELINIHTDDVDNMFITADLNEIIREKAKAYEGKISVDLNDLIGVPMFLMEIHNNELSRILDKIKDTIDKSAVTTKMDRHTLLQTLVETIIEGSLDVMAIHTEVILSNQLRNVEDILEKPQWEYSNEQYNVLTLSQSLSYNPSIIVTLSYERISRALFNPLTFRKRKASFMDLFFMEKPQEYLNNKGEIREAVVDTFTGKELKQVVRFVDVPDALEEELDTCMPDSFKDTDSDSEE